MQNLQVLDKIDAVAGLTKLLVRRAALPAKAIDDAHHVALAAVHGLGFLVTWNCKHNADPVTRFKIEQTCREAGYTPPLICTPEELLEALHDE